MPPIRIPSARRDRIRAAAAVGAVLAMLGLLGTPAAAKCPQSCKRQIKTGLKQCDRVCPKGKAGSTCRKTCQALRRAAAAACINGNAAGEIRPEAPASPDCGSRFPLCLATGQQPCGDLFECCTKPTALACVSGRCCTPEDGACTSNGDCCPGLTCVTFKGFTACVSPTTTTTTTNTTSTTLGTGGLNCTGYASQETPGSSTLIVYGTCSTLGTATGIGFLFETPFAPLTQFTNPSNGTCQITSWSPGTNNYYVCNGAYVLGPAMTIPGGTVTGSNPPGPTLPVSFYVIQGSTVHGPFPVNYAGG